MTPNRLVTNAIQAILNRDNSYPGDLTHYYRALFKKAKNLRNLYHNYGHIIHVFWFCYEAGLWYLQKGKITAREFRNLLIAALFHDFDHSGKVGNDPVEIANAIKALRRYLAPEDESEFDEIVKILKSTQFPPELTIEEPSILQQIIMDVDLTQALGLVWTQSVVFGLGTEMGKTPVEMLEMQEPFFTKVVKFKTKWAKQMFPQSMIDERIQLAKDILSIVKEEDPLLEAQSQSA